ncbi:MAG: tyrosine-type recombinase/integrase [Planctomycetota bacterium]|nr:tyrosine-type recombinase/integrase [Planctomycetota bacterium]
MATVRAWQTKRGRVFYIDYYTSEGRRVREKVGPDKRRAERRAALIEEAKFKGDPAIDLLKIGPGEALQEFLCSSEDDNSTSWVTYQRKILTHFVVWTGVRELRRITPLMIEKWVRHRLKQGRSVTTARTNFGMIRTFLRWAKGHRYIAFDPSDNAKRLKPKPRGEIRVISQEEADELLEACRTPIPLLGPGRKGNGKTRERKTPLFEMVSVALFTGFRLGEILNLTWDCIDFKTDPHTISVKVSKDFTPKDREGRILPLDPFLADVLLRHQKRTRQFKGLVFRTEAGTRYDGRNVGAELQKAAKRADIDGGCNFYALRHTFASSLTAANIDIRWVQGYLGHSDIRTTIQHYAAFRPERTHEAIAKLPYGRRLEMAGS